MRCAQPSINGDWWRLQSPLFRPQNLHPLGVRYDPGRADALQLLGDVCMTPLPLDRDFLEAAGSTEAKPAHLVRSKHAKPSLPSHVCDPRQSPALSLFCKNYAIHDFARVNWHHEKREHYDWDGIAGHSNTRCLCHLLKWQTVGWCHSKADRIVRHHSNATCRSTGIEASHARSPLLSTKYTLLHLSSHLRLIPIPHSDQQTKNPASHPYIHRKPVV